MPRQKGVFLVRALDHFKGNMRFEHETKGKRKRKQLRFKLHDVIRVTSGAFAGLTAAGQVCKLIQPANHHLLVTRTVNTEDGLYFGTLIKNGKTGWFPYYYVVHL